MRRVDGREDIDSLDHVHGGDGSIGICLLAVTDETETTATSGIPVFDDDLRARRSDIKHQDLRLDELTASSTWPNSSNLVRRAVSSVCHARPLIDHQSVVDTPCEESKV